MRGILAVIIKKLDFEGQLRWVYGVFVEFVENAVRLEGFRGVFAANRTKAKPSKKPITPRQCYSIPLSSALKQGGEERI
jgi:hypothetical protein